MTLSDLGRVQWPATLKLAFARSVASGLVISALMLLSAGGGALGGPGSVGLWFLMWSCTAFIGAPMTALTIRGLNRIFEAMGLGVAVLAGNLMLLMVAVAMALGDPIVYLLVKRFPAIFDVADFKPFNLQALILVLDDGALPASAKLV